MADSVTHHEYDGRVAVGTTRTDALAGEAMDVQQQVVGGLTRDHGRGEAVADGTPGAAECDDAATGADAVGKHSPEPTGRRERTSQRESHNEPRREPERRRRWLRITGSILLTALAAVLVLGAVVVNVQHWKLEPVLSGSMRPDIQPGDLAIIRPVPVDDIEVGDVIAYLPPGHSIPVLHRIVSLDEEGFVTQGDANNTTDPWGRVKPQGTSVQRLMTVIPKLGFVLNVRSLLLKILGVIFLVAVAVWLWAMIHDRKKGSGTHDDHDDDPGDAPDDEAGAGPGPDDTPDPGDDSDSPASAKTAPADRQTDSDPNGEEGDETTDHTASGLPDEPETADRTEHSSRLTTPTEG